MKIKCFYDCTYIRTDETDETASGGGFDSFEKWFLFQQKKMRKSVPVSKTFHSTNGQFPKPGQNRNQFRHNKEGSTVAQW